MAQQDFDVKDSISGIISDLNSVVKQHPYVAFSVLFLLIEFLGKCLNSKDWDKGKSSKEFYDAIQKYNNLQKYKTFNSTPQKNYNDLYKIRCAFAHRLLIDAGFMLDKGCNDFSRNIIGCKDLYDDIQLAWQDVLQGNIVVKKNLNIKKMSINGTLSGNPTTIATTKNDKMNDVIIYGNTNQ